MSTTQDYQAAEQLLRRPAALASSSSATRSGRGGSTEAPVSGTR
jgi:hypothetical protein